MPIPIENNPALPWRAFYRAVDAMDLEGFLGFVHPEATMRVANWPVVSGTENIRALVEGAWRQWRVLRHRIENVWEEGDTTIVEAMIDHTLADGRDVTTPCVTIVQWRNGKLFRHRAFEDPSPLVSQ